MATFEQRLSKTNQSTEKVLSVIELLSKNKEPMRIQDISKELHINVSTLVRFLTTLMKCGYVSQEETSSRYYLTFKICTISYRVSSQHRLTEFAHPYLQKLSDECRESVCLAIEQDLSVVYVDVVEGPDKIVRTMQRVGSSSPMHCTGSGKLLLLNSDDKKIDKLISDKGLQKFTSHTITTHLDLTKELLKASATGYAVDDEECEIGAKCIAVPIRDYTGRIIAAVSMTGPVFRMSDEDVAKHLPRMLKTAKEISTLLGYEE